MAMNPSAWRDLDRATFVSTFQRGVVWHLSFLNRKIYQKKKYYWLTAIRCFCLCLQPLLSWCIMIAVLTAVFWGNDYRPLDRDVVRQRHCCSHLGCTKLDCCQQKLQPLYSLKVGSQPYVAVFIFWIIWIKIVSGSTSHPLPAASSRCELLARRFRSGGLDGGPWSNNGVKQRATMELNVQQRRYMFGMKTVWNGEPISSN